jgi:glutathione S-transferase
MKLYFSAGSCSTSCHITLEESGLKYETVEIDFDNATDPNLALIQKLNPLGTLPILITDDGKQLDQNASIHCYVADLAPAANLLPAPNTFERAKALNYLSFVCSDLHKSIGGLFSVKYVSQDSNVQKAVREWGVARSNEVLQYLNNELAGKDYLMGAQFTVADAYAFVVVSWTKWVEVSLAPYANVEKYMARVAARPAVQRVLKAEGLL